MEHTTTNKINPETEKLFDRRFTCIQRSCDGNGNIPHQVSHDEWEAEQCQFHGEYLFPLKQFIADAEARAEKRVFKKIEGMKKSKFARDEEMYNNAIDDVLALADKE